MEMDRGHKWDEVSMDGIIEMVNEACMTVMVEWGWDGERMESGAARDMHMMLSQTESSH